jgi:hypothetical protein
MGAAVSVSHDEAKVIHLKQLPDAIEEALYVHEKFVLIVDTSEQASRFLKYQVGSFINMDEPIPITKLQLNRSLVGAMQHGRTMTLKFNTLRGLQEGKLFDEENFPSNVISKISFFNESVWSKLLKPELGDPNVDEFSISPEFAFIICTVSDADIPPALTQLMCVIKVEDKSSDQQSSGDSNVSDDPLEQIAALYGAGEIKRYITYFKCDYLFAFAETAQI